MAVVQINNIEMYYEIRGDGPPLVLVAGYTCDHKFWNQMVPSLAKNFRVVTFDNRGIGQTTDDGQPFSIDTMAADTATLIEHLGLARPTVVGQSMGGAIVQAMLARFPDSCGKCVIINSTRVFSAGAIMALEHLLALRKANIDLDFQVNASLRLLAGLDWLSVPANIANFKAAIRDNPAPQSVADQERQLAALKTFDARRYRRPRGHATLVISAIEDILIPTLEGEALANSLGADHVLIGGGHQSPAEQPDCLLQILTEFHSG